MATRGPQIPEDQPSPLNHGDLPSDNGDSAQQGPPGVSVAYDDYYQRLHQWIWTYNWNKFCWEQQQREARDRACWYQWSMALATQLHARTPHTNLPGAQLRIFPRFGNNANGPQLNVPQAAQNHPQIFVGAIGPNNQMDTSWKGFKTAEIWKRVVAETFDILLLMLFKIFLTWTILEDIFLLDLDKYKNILDGDMSDVTTDVALELLSDLAMLEFAHRMISCFYEVVMTVHGFEHAGATFGKYLMGLRVVSCGEFILLDGMILVKPGETPTLRQAFIRAVLKNYSWAMALPLSLTAFLNKERRCTYDTICKCIVVEVRDPMFRRFIG